IGRGNCALGSPAAPVSTDQRGTARKGPICDAGAFEAGAYSSVVRNTNDSGPNKLRLAVMDAPAGTNVTFDSPLFNVPQTIILTSGTITIATGQVINGPGANLTAVDGHLSSQVFKVNNGVTATISGLTIQNGTNGLTDGGGIGNAGTLTISSSALSG